MRLQRQCELTSIAVHDAQINLTSRDLLRCGAAEQMQPTGRSEGSTPTGSVETPYPTRVARTSSVTLPCASYLRELAECSGPFSNMSTRITTSDSRSA